SSTGDYMPLAFDAACPVENMPNVSIGIDASTLEAVCPKCGSRYNVLNGAGGPLGGPALTQRYGLRIYKVRASQNGGYIITSY
ncbi:MAG: (2Fe-2S)-binding protein, partial [Muribaculaceae bacterium]|nr:(2Fe-2S)-binding protein [Muribaculaceae bacterium]